MKTRSEEKGNARTGDGGSVSKDVSATAGADVHGVYSARCVGPREDERVAYVAARDAAVAARGREMALRSVIAREERPRNRLRSVIAAIAVAVGFAAGAGTPVVAMARADLAQARADVARAEARLGTFVLEEKWHETAFENLVTTVGKNLALDTILAGSAYTVTGPYMGLIDANANLAVIGDTMASHASWTEVGGTNAPAYTGNRKTPTFSSASAGSKATSAAVSFAITSLGTVGGCFMLFGSGAVATKDNTSGTLYSAGAFTGGNKAVDNGDTLNVTYTASM